MTILTFRRASSRSLKIDQNQTSNNARIFSWVPFFRKFSALQSCKKTFFKIRCLVRFKKIIKKIFVKNRQFFDFFISRFSPENRKNFGLRVTLEYFCGYRSFGNFPLYKVVKKHFLKSVVLCDLKNI